MENKISECIGGGQVLTAEIKTGPAYEPALFFAVFA